MQIITCLRLLSIATALSVTCTFSGCAAVQVPTRGVHSADTAHCVTPANLDLRRLLPPFPAIGSQEARGELEELLRLQAERTPAQATRARADVEISVFRFADALGSPAGFTAAHLPLTAAFFDAVETDASAVIGPVKDEFARPRPFKLEPRLEPSVPRAGSGSYPSGHAAWAYTAALVLADMVPERREQIFERAREYAHNRNIGGVHYPSDIEAGRLAATAIAAMLFSCVAFQHDEAAAQAELRRALGLTARTSEHQ